MSEEIVRYRLGEHERASLERRTATYEHALSTDAGREALEYLRGRGFEDATIRKFRLGYVATPIEGDGVGEGRISVPYLTPSGPSLIKFRAVGSAEPKMLYRPGTRTSIYNVRRISERKRELAICEGEFDTAIAEQCGIHAIGIPGVSNWKSHWYPLFTGYDTVRILADDDEPGRQFAERVHRELAERGCNVQTYVMPDGMDVNEVYLNGGKDAVRKAAGFKEDHVVSVADVF